MESQRPGGLLPQGAPGVAVLVAALLALTLAVVPAGAAEYADTNEAVWQTNSTGLVRDLATDDTLVFVGGSFTGLRPDAQSSLTAQPWLAAVDAQTGALVPSFAPVLDGEVWALELSADGSMLFVGGEFSNVNGQSRRGIVALDPTTGATLPGFAGVANSDVLDLAVDGNHLYLAGRFWQINGVQREKVARVDAGTGVLDGSWGPFANGGDAAAVAVDPVLDRVYVGGFFSDVDGVLGTDLLAAVSRSTGAVVTAFDPTPTGEVYDLLATPTRLYSAAGGPGGTVDGYETFTGQREVSWFGDGDLQVLARSDDRLLSGGHHNTGFGAGPVSPVASIGLFDDVVDPTFDPPLNFQVGIGVWALLPTDTDLWVGGAISSAGPVPVRGIARYPLTVASPPVDVTAPTVPTGLAVPSVSDVSVRLAWNAATDASSPVAYVVERDGTPIGATTELALIDTTVTSEQTYAYTVRAVDPAGNSSAVSTAVLATTLGPLAEITPIPWGSTWRYLDSGVDPVGAWTTASFDDSTWASGAAELGRGDGDEATIIANVPATFLRDTFVVGVDQVVADATLRLRRDDGVVVHVNGVEVARDNVPDGPVDASTTAVGFVFGVGENEVLEYPLDPALFGPGDNVVAVSLHNTPSSGDLSFAAELTLRVGAAGADTTAPSTPAALAVAGTTEGSVSLAWQASTDNVAVTGYTIWRDGVAVGTTAATSFTDAPLAAATAFSYEVTASDAAGNQSPPTAAVVATTADLPNGSVELIGAASVWAYDDTGFDPGPSWAQPSHDDGGWETGLAELGAGDGDEVTVIDSRPVTYFRHTFAVGDPSAIGALTLDLLADDGAVAYLNGVEVVRDNVGPGAVDHFTPAASYRWTAQDETVPLTWTVPAALLVPGANTLAVSLHNGAGSGDSSFDATLTAVYTQGPDTTPPGAATGLSVSDTTSSTATLIWNGAVDNVGIGSYTVRRDGVEIGTATSTSFTDTGLAAATSYTYDVIAVDLAGNIGPASASVDAITLGAVLDFVTAGSTWSYHDLVAAPPADWASPTFDDSGWPAGSAELGVGDGDESTVITVRPVTYYRTTFDLLDPSALLGLDLELLADDGAVVYLNGIELVRDNVAPGPVDHTTPAAGYRWTPADETAFRPFSLPLSAAVAGTNTLAISVHQGLGSGDVSFDVALSGREGNGSDVTPPSAPGTPVVGLVTESSADLIWGPATDDVGVDRYRVLRDGFVVATTTDLAYTDTGLDPATTYSWTIAAVDAAGNVGPASASASATTEIGPQDTELVAADAMWAYLDTGVDPAAGWTSVGFDDAAWLVGPAELGAGDGGEATVLTNQPVVFFRFEFEVADAAAVTDLLLELLADDGAVVYLNGVEVLRDNVGPGAADASTPALGYRFGSAESTLVPFVLDPADLVAGTNSVAISVHNGPGSSDLSFQAVLTATS